MTAGEPETGQFFSCDRPLLVPNQPYSSDSSFNVCGTFRNPGNDRPTTPGTGYNYSNMLTATAFVAGNNLDVNAIVGTVVARKGNTGGAGIGGMGHAEHQLAVAHGIELEADCHAPGTNCDQARSALFLAGGGNGGLAIQSFQEWRSSAEVNSPRQGILLGSGVPINPLQSAGGAVMRSAGRHVQADYGIDLRQMVANKASFASEGFEVSGKGKVTGSAFACGNSTRELCAKVEEQERELEAQARRIARLERALARLGVMDDEPEQSGRAQKTDDHDFSRSGCGDELARHGGDAEAACSFAGTCVSGRCECDVGWKGSFCEQLDLLPATRDPRTPRWIAPGTLGYNQLNAAGHWTSSWGGAVVRDDNGTYHMWVNELTDSCGMYYW